MYVNKYHQIRYDMLAFDISMSYWFLAGSLVPMEPRTKGQLLGREVTGTAWVWITEMLSKNFGKGPNSEG